MIERQKMILFKDSKARKMPEHKNQPIFGKSVKSLVNLVTKSPVLNLLKKV